jgi:hypothetical protein
MIQSAMQLTKVALSHVKRNKRIRSLLALACNRTEYTILRWAEANNDNLTKAAAIKIIREETGLPDSQILEVSKIEAQRIARNKKVGLT